MCYYEPSSMPLASQRTAYYFILYSVFCAQFLYLVLLKSFSTLVTHLVTSLSIVPLLSNFEFNITSGFPFVFILRTSLRLSIILTSVSIYHYPDKVPGSLVDSNTPCYVVQAGAITILLTIR